MDVTGVVWRKSSRSGQGGNDACVEIAFVANAHWRKSSRSGGGGNDACVEVASVAEAVAVRDSKNPAGPVLAWPAVAWQGFLAQRVKADLR